MILRFKLIAGLLNGLNLHWKICYVFLLALWIVNKGEAESPTVVNSLQSPRKNKQITLWFRNNTSLSTNLVLRLILGMGRRCRVYVTSEGDHILYWQTCTIKLFSIKYPTFVLPYIIYWVFSSYISRLESFMISKSDTNSKWIVFILSGSFPFVAKLLHKFQLHGKLESENVICFWNCVIPLYVFYWRQRFSYCCAQGATHLAGSLQ